MNEEGIPEALNPDIEEFLKHNALQFAREKKSITYLVCDEDDGSLLGYFTITHKAVEVPPDGLTEMCGRTQFAGCHPSWQLLVNIKR